MRNLINYLGTALLPLISIISLANAETICADQVCVETVQTEDGVIFSISNNKPMLPVSVIFDLNLDNMEVASGSSDPFILPGGTTDQEIFTLKPVGSGRWRWRYDFTWHRGMFNAAPTPGYLYNLPFPAGISEQVNQGCNGALSHTGSDRYAIDFGTNEGDPIAAARSGVVVDVVETNETGGASRTFLELDNRIIIQHEDRTLAIYSHLQKNGALVEIGQTIRTGELIAFSGNTGFSTGPHLHFAVTKVSLEEGEITLPIEFTTSEGAITCPSEGSALTSVNSEQE